MQRFVLWPIWDFNSEELNSGPTENVKQAIRDGFD